MLSTKSLSKLAQFALILSISTLTACVREQFQDEQLEDLHEVVFHAGWDAETKTVLQEDGKVFWAPGDEISLFVGNGINGGYKLTSTNTEPAANTDFIGQIGERPSGVSYVAVYPYNVTNWVSDNKVRYDIPSEQIAREGSFDPNAFVSIACSENESLYFKNMCSGIKFSVKTPGIKKIEISSTNGYLSGEFAYVMSTEEISLLTPLLKASILSPTESGFEIDKYYYIALNPTVCPNGVTVSFYTEDKVARFQYDQPIEFKRGVFKRLYDKDADLVYKAPAMIYEVIPESFDKNSVLEVYFHVKSDKTTEFEVSSSGSPVFAELQNGILNLYTPGDVYDITYAAKMFENWRNLKYVDTSHWDTSDCTNMSYMFKGCSSLETVDLTSFNTLRVENMNSMFAGCSSLKTLDFSSFRTPVLIDMGCMFQNYVDVCLPGVRIPSNLEYLDLSTFDVSNVTNMDSMFAGCSKLKEVNLSTWETDQLCYMAQMFMGCFSLKSVNLSSFNTYLVTNMCSLFEDCASLREIELSNFDISNVRECYQMFYGCRNLEKLYIGNFTFQSNALGYSMFAGCTSLRCLDLRNCTIPEGMDISTILNRTARISRACAVRCNSDTEKKLKQEIEENRDLVNPDWFVWISPENDIPELPDNRDKSVYYSSDFSMHNSVNVIQKATVGKGINIAIMGDQYTDRLINDGTYDADMTRAVEAIFSVEPFKSHRNYFNVSMVYLVSDTEIAEQVGGTTALSVDHGLGNGETVVNASFEAFPASNSSMISDIVICHDPTSFEGSGADGITGMTFQWDSDYGGYNDYGQGSTQMCYIPSKVSIGRSFDRVVVHEFGHCFGKLADEYLDSTEYPNEYDIDYIKVLERFGAYKNIDLASDLSTIKWNQFIADGRYYQEFLGAYEGAGWSHGIYRSTDDSIMNSINVDYFNAPSREAIYYRIHKLAYGEDWQYDYETFVQQDLKNIPAATKAASAKYVPYPARVNKRPLFKMEESTTLDGKKMITVIMD